MKNNKRVNDNQKGNLFPLKENLQRENEELVKKFSKEGFHLIIEDVVMYEKQNPSKRKNIKD
jgi:hypothetical protein